MPYMPGPLKQQAAGPGVPKGVDGVGEEGMTRRQRSVDQQPSQDL